MRLLYFDAKPYYETEPVRELMLLALPYPNEEMLDRLLQRYYDDEDMRLIGAMDGENNLQGLIGVKIDDVGVATILHLRVQDSVQHHGIGGALVRKVIVLLGLQRLNGRSGEHLLPFFTGLGFSNWVIGEKPPGTKWYGVSWGS